MTKDTKGNSRRGPRSKRGAQPYAWDDRDAAEWLMGLAIGAAMVGGALRIGHTRDGGALALGVYLGEDYGTEYVRPDEDLAQAVREISLGWGIPIAIHDDEAGRFILPQKR